MVSGEGEGTGKGFLKEKRGYEDTLEGERENFRVKRKK